jgi:protein glucosyltransferase
VYNPCSQENCSCHTSVIEKDLSPFKNGITKAMINSVKDK